MKAIDDMVWLDEINEYVTVQEYKEYINYIQNLFQSQVQIHNFFS